MYLDSLPTDNVEDEVGLNYHDPITVLTESGMARDPSEEWMMFKLPHAII
jgi:hypothetical protein